MTDTTTKNSTKYTSRGKISVNFAATSCAFSIYFIPDSDYSLRRSDKNYGVFVDSDVDKSNAIIRNYEAKGIEINIESKFLKYIRIAIVQAALQQISVEVIVNECNGKLKMAEIRIPDTDKPSW